MKRFFSFLAAATMLFAASCAEDTVGTDNGNVAQVTFNLGLEGQSGTRADIGNGLTVTDLYYQVFDENRVEIALTPDPVHCPNAFSAEKRVATINLQLAKGQKYYLVVWAQHKDSGYEVKDGMVIDANYDQNVASNNEKRDAFCKVHEFTPEDADPNVILTRPFAQLNVGVTDADYKAAVKSNVTIAQSKVTISKVYNTFDVFNHDFRDALENVTFAMAARPGQTLDVELNGTPEIQADEQFHYLSMNYLLIGDNSDIGAKFCFEAAENVGEVNKHIDFELATIPVELNHRTNIIGQILTGNLDFNVKIDAGFANNEITSNIWDGSAKQPKIETVNGQEVVSITSGENLAWLAQLINGTITRSAADDYSDMIIRLENDIDLNNINWTPIGNENNTFNGTFDGNGKTIKNLSIVSKTPTYYMGFFGTVDGATIKNVTFENINVNVASDNSNEGGHIAGVAGYAKNTTFEAITVKGLVKVESTFENNASSRVAVIAGGNYGGKVTMKNVKIEANKGSYVKANNCLGALAGQLQGEVMFESCSSNIEVIGYKFFAGGIIGLAPQNGEFKNCSVSANVSITNGREGNANDLYRVGAIAGGWDDEVGKVLTLTDCSYTGELSGKDAAAGTIATEFDCGGFVGRGYSAKVGPIVSVNGVEYKYAGNGVYTINGLTPVSTADELVAALEANEGVFFMNDIKIEPAKMSNAYGKTGINVKNGQTIDGNGYTLNIKGAGGTWDSGINTTGGLIKNLTVTGSFRGIFINHTSTHSEKVILENVTIGGNGTVYTISCDQGLYQGIEARNCTFNGWTSFAKTAGEAKFINCSFGEGSTYKYCRPYSNTEFVNCTFCSGYAVDETQATVTFTNCTWEE